VIVTSKFEMASPAQPSTRGAVAAQSSDQDQPQQTFSASLLAASKSSSEESSTNSGSSKTGRRQSSTSDDAKAPSIASDSSTAQSQIASQQTAPQQTQVINTDIIPVSVGDSATSNDSTAVAAGQTMLDLASTGLSGAESSIAQLAGIQSKVTPAQQSTDASDGAPSKITQDAPATGLAGSESSIAQTSNNSSQASLKLQDAGIQGLNAPTVSSPKSGEDNTSAVTPAAPSTTSDGVQDPATKAAMDAIASAVQSTVANIPSSGSSASVLHAALNASAKEALASALNTGSTVQTSPATAAVDHSLAAAAISVPSGTSDPLAGLSKSAWLFGTHQSGSSSVNSALAAKPQTSSSANGKDVNADQSGVKQHTQPVSDDGSKSSSQDTTSSNDQSQSGNTSQALNATSVLTNFANHAAAAMSQSQSAATISTPQSSSTLTGAANVTAKTASNPAPASTAAPQVLPAINTAKLIQSMGQSEMRVGMRSTEFGSISISTSASRDLISAQISLDHGELAKTLAAHLPEMQARLGSNQVMDVRIEMNGTGTGTGQGAGQGAGQGTGTSGSLSNSSSDQSQSGRQQAGNAATSYSSNGAVAQQLSPAVAAISTGYAHLDTRLDIRV
jgi:hypothetical protein